MKIFLPFFLVAALGMVSILPAAEVSAIMSQLESHDFEKNSGYDGVPDNSDQAWRVHILAIRDLLRAGKTDHASIIAYLGSPNRHVRQAAVLSLGLLKAGDAAYKIQKLASNDPDPIVRGYAAEAMGQIFSPGARVALEKIIAADSNDDVKHRAELALGALAYPTPGYEELTGAFRKLDESSFEQLEVGKRAPEFSLKDTKGNPWTLNKALAGHDYLVLIWIFADWCGVCQREFHDLQELKGDFEKLKVGVASFECREQYRCDRMVDGRDLWWPHLVDLAGATGAAYGVDPMEFWVHNEWINRPSTIILDRDGKVLWAYYGTFWGDRPTIDQTLGMIKSGKYDFEHPKRKK